MLFYLMCADAQNRPESPAYKEQVDPVFTQIKKWYLDPHSTRENFPNPHNFTREVPRNIQKDFDDLQDNAYLYDEVIVQAVIEREIKKENKSFTLTDLRVCFYNDPAGLLEKYPPKFVMASIWLLYLDKPISSAAGAAVAE